MKQRILVLFILTILLIPYDSYANVLDEIPPYIEIVGVDENNYKISKTIKDDEIVVDLVEKDTGLNYSWSFDKNQINSKITLDFSIDFKSKKKQEIDNITGNINKVYLSFAHHGSLPSVARIRVDVSNNFKDGNKLFLYYYNEETKKLEFIDDDIKVIDGYAEFEIEHCSEYILTAASVNETISKMRILSYIIVALGILVLILMGYTMFKK